MIYDQPVLHQFALVLNGFFYTMQDLADQGYVLISIDDAFTSDTLINTDNYIGLNRDVLNSQFFQGRRITLRFALTKNRNWMLYPNRYITQGTNIQLVYYKEQFTLDTTFDDAIDNSNAHVYSNANTYVFSGVVAMCTLTPFDEETVLSVEIYLPDPFIRKLKTMYSVPLYNNVEQTTYKILFGFRNVFLSEYPTIPYTVPIALVDAETTSENYFVGKAYPFWVKHLTDDITYNSPGTQYWTAQLIINDAVKRLGANSGLNVYIIKQRQWHSMDTPDLYNEDTPWTAGVEYAMCSVPASDLTGKTLTGGSIYQYVNPYQLKLTVSWSGGNKTYDFTRGSLCKRGGLIDTFYLAIQDNFGLSGSSSLLDPTDTKPWINYYGSYLSLDQID